MVGRLSQDTEAPAAQGDFFTSGREMDPGRQQGWVVIDGMFANLSGASADLRITWCLLTPEVTCWELPDPWFFTCQSFSKATPHFDIV